MESVGFVSDLSDIMADLVPVRRSDKKKVPKVTEAPWENMGKRKPREFRRTMKRRYGSWQVAEKIHLLMKSLAKSTDSWSESWTKREEALNRLGFLSYADYINSDLWKTKRGEYLDSCLLQACMFCGNPNFMLHHQNYAFLGREDISRLLPLCKSHHDQLHRFLMEHGIPLEWSLAFVPYSFGCRDKYKCQRQMLKFRYGLLRYRLQQLGLDCEFRPNPKCFPQKKSRKKDKKLIYISDSRGKPVARAEFDVKTGIVKMGRNGFQFENWCDHLPDCLREKT